LSNYSAATEGIESGIPYKSYRKTILGQVFATILDNFNGESKGIILTGDPYSETAIVDVWNDREEIFFRRNNRRHLEMGTIIEFKRVVPSEAIVPELYADYTDEQLKDILSGRGLAVVTAVRKITSESVMIRLISLAEEMEKSVKLIDNLKAHLAELQFKTNTPKEE
jgi:hypothetical protein